MKPGDLVMWSGLDMSTKEFENHIGIVVEVMDEYVNVVHQYGHVERFHITWFTAGELEVVSEAR